MKTGRVIMSNRPFAQQDDTTLSDTRRVAAWPKLVVSRKPLVDGRAVVQSLAALLMRDRREAPDGAASTFPHLHRAPQTAAAAALLCYRQSGRTAYRL